MTTLRRAKPNIHVRTNTLIWRRARALAIEVNRGAMLDGNVSAELRLYIAEVCNPWMHNWVHTKAMKTYKRKLELLRQQGERHG